MFFFRLTLASACLFLLNGSREQAAQIVLLGLAVHKAQGHFLQKLLLSPLYLFILFGIILEVVHFIFKRKYTSARETWKHIQEIKSACDTEALIHEMLVTKDYIWNLQDWNTAVAEECAKKG
jgi:hypothetical protein